MVKRLKTVFYFLPAGSNCFLLADSRRPFFLRVRIAWVESFILTFLPSTITVLDWRFGFQTFLVWRCEKLTLWPYCLPLPVISHFCIRCYFSSKLLSSQTVAILGGNAWRYHGNAAYNSAGVDFDRLEHP